MPPELPNFRWIPDWVENGVNYVARRGWLPILAVLLGVGAFWAFIEIADMATDTDDGPADSHVFDLAVFKSIAGQYDRVSGFWQEAGRDLTAMGGSTVITLMVAGVVIFLLLSRQWKSALFVVISVAGGLALSLFLKQFFDRPRPDIFDYRSHTMTASFPSGHSANSAVAYFTMAVLLAKLVSGHWMKAYIFAVGLLIPFLVGFSRIFLGVHWPTDVLAGWLLGLSWGLIVWGVATFLQRRGQLEQEGEIANAQQKSRDRAYVS